MSHSATPWTIHPWNSPDQNTGWVAIPFSGIEPRSPALQVDSFPAEPPGKPEYAGVGSLSLLQRIFLTQESNQSLLHCRWILYQLSHQGPTKTGVGSLSLLQQIFLTQESNQSLLHCKQILCHLNHQGSSLAIF